VAFILDIVDLSAAALTQCSRLWTCPTWTQVHAYQLSVTPRRTMGQVSYSWVWGFEFCATEKGKKEYLYSAILADTPTHKVLRHGSHSFTCKLHHACLSFISVHQMSPPWLR